MPEADPTEPARSIVLVGAPGAGKSTVGGLLADRLGLPFVDVDVVIADRAAKSIAEIFAEDGEQAFRAVEERTTAEFLSSGGVVALGGGAVLSTRTRTALAGHRVIWLQVGISQSVGRIGMNEARPLLLGNVRGRLIKLLAERRPLYAEVATETVDTDALEPAAIVDSIMNSRS